MSDIAISEDGKLALASNFIDISDVFSQGKGSLEIYDLSSNNNKVYAMNFDYSSIDMLRFNPEDINQLIFVEGEKIDVLNLSDKKIQYTFIHGDAISGYVIKSNIIASSSYDGTIRFWQMVNDGFEFEPHRITLPGSITNLQYASGIFTVTLWKSDKAYILHNLQNNDAISLEGHGNSIRSACYTKDNKKTTVQYLFYW